MLDVPLYILLPLAFMAVLLVVLALRRVLPALPALVSSIGIGAFVISSWLLDSPTGRT
jgi:hypothetical protein